MEEVKTIKLSWEEVSEYVAIQVRKILDRDVICNARCDNSEYWTVFILSERMHLSELFKIFEVVGADELQREDSLPESAMTEGSVKTIGMDVSEMLLKRYLGFEWERKIIDSEYLWLIGRRSI